MEMTSATSVEALNEYMERAETGKDAEKGMAKPDLELLAMLVHGSSAELTTLDEMISGALSTDWTIDRIEAIMRAILRVGIWEIKNRQSTPARVAISEYVDLARAFYSGTEPNLVNAVMDRMARILRPHEFEH
jgi:N utilization substance protein B